MPNREFEQTGEDFPLTECHEEELYFLIAQSINQGPIQDYSRKY